MLSLYHMHSQTYSVSFCKACSTTAFRLRERDENNWSQIRECTAEKQMKLCFILVKSPKPFSVVWTDFLPVFSDSHPEHHCSRLTDLKQELQTLIYRTMGTNIKAEINDSNVTCGFWDPVITAHKAGMIAGSLNACFSSAVA